MDYDYIDSTVNLKYSTSQEVVSQTLQSCIASYELLFPGRIRSYFLVGSYLDGSAVQNSDLDVVVLFKHKVTLKELEAFWHLHYQLNLISPIPLGFNVIHESYFEQGVSLHFRESKLLYGQDVLKNYPNLSREMAEQRFISSAIKLIYRIHNVNTPLSIPVHFPDQKALYFGFNFKVQQQNTPKRLMNLVARIISALLILKTGEQPKSKRHSILCYQENIGGRWADYANKVEKLVKYKWQYQMPETQEDQQQLTELCQQLLEFENNFLGFIKPRLIQDDQKWAIDCQKYITFSEKDDLILQL